MFVFLSYAHEQKDIAEEVSLAVRHDVFFDRTELPPGKEFHRAIRENVEKSDALIFLVSPDSVKKGCYALTELKYAKQKWPRPEQKVFPVMVEQTDVGLVPKYLAAVTIFEPEGNIPAEVADEFDRWFNVEPSTQTPPPPEPVKPLGLFEILPGTWQLQVFYPNGMSGQGQAQIFPNGGFQISGSTPMAMFTIGGNWQVVQSNAILLQGQQNVAYQILPFFVTIQFSRITPNNLVGIMNTGETTNWFKLA